MEYDLAVIGAGWAGFNAALTAKGLGLKVCLIEKSHIGGTCLNLGCIPTKALIQSAKIYSTVKKSSSFGIEASDVKVDFKQIQERKEKIIQQLASGMQFMLKGIDLIDAEASILSANELKAGSQSIKARFILICTGSKPVELKDIKFDGDKILSSNDILSLKEIPGSLLIIGGGVIGCEFASLFLILGVKVTVVEKMPQLLPGEDADIARKLENIFKKKGIRVDTGTDATSLNQADYDKVLVCVGRSASYGNLELEKIGIKTDKGRILVDEYLKTSIDNIYAAGDCTGKFMLAHFAAYQGRIAAENIAQGKSVKKCDNKNVPNCIFTDPEIASIGAKEGEVVNKFDFLGSGMARIIDETEGFIKIFSDKKTGQILGASIIGPRATELIAVLGLAVSNQLKLSQIKDTIFAHPTLSESISEALD